MKTLRSYFANYKEKSELDGRKCGRENRRWPLVDKYIYRHIGTKIFCKSYFISF